MQGQNTCLFFGQMVQLLRMNNVISALDEYFCAHYSDYVHLAALEGYVMPDMLLVGSDGNIRRRDSSLMRLCYQKECAAILPRLKEELADTTFTFSFRFRTFAEKMKPFAKYTFARLLPAALSRCGESVESAGEKLDIEPRFWKKIAKGKLIPEKNTVIALALVCRMTEADVNNLFNACGFSFDEKSVRDVVVRYLLEQKVFSPELRDMCLAEYKITNLPIKKEYTEA